MEELEKNETSTQAEENTVSLASAQALADALAKIEAYTPTTWVDNSSPDIDAEHLNKPEQAIKRVTDALNSAVDVIKDLQSQVTKNAGAISDVNNNLSNKADKTSLLSYALKSDLLNFKTFQISIKTNTVKDGESQMYHGNVKISDDKNCPPNTVCIIPYGARLETDARRAGIISYRATDTFCAVSHPTISNKNFIVTVLAIYKS